MSSESNNARELAQATLKCHRPIGGSYPNACIECSDTYGPVDLPCEPNELAAVLLGALDELDAEKGKFSRLIHAVKEANEGGDIDDDTVAFLLFSIVEPVSHDSGTTP